MSRAREVDLLVVAWGFASALAALLAAASRLAS
jgi:hypothetical protein